MSIKRFISCIGDREELGITSLKKRDGLGIPGPCEATGEGSSIFEDKHRKRGRRRGEKSKIVGIDLQHLKEKKKKTQTKVGDPGCDANPRKAYYRKRWWDRSDDTSSISVKSGSRKFGTIGVISERPIKL